MTQADNGNPYTLTGPGQQLTLTQPGAGGYPNQNPPPWVILQNDSSLQLSWSTGSNSGTIQAWATSPPIVLGAGAGAGSGPQQVTITTSGLGSGDLNVTWSDDGDVIPAGYPSTSGVSASAVATQAAIEVAAIDMTLGVSGDIDSGIIPPGAVGLLLISTADTAQKFTQLSGNATGAVYAALFYVAGLGQLWLPYNSTADPQFNIGWPAALANGILEIYAIFASINDLPTDGQYNPFDGGSGLATPPAYAKLVAGIDPTQAEEPVFVPLEVDGNGRLVPLVPTMVTGFKSVVSGGNVLAAPGSGGNYIFGIDVRVPTQDSLDFGFAFETASDFYASIYCAVANQTFSTPDLGGQRTTKAINYFGVTVDQAALVNIRYAPGP